MELMRTLSFVLIILVIFGFDLYSLSNRMSILEARNELVLPGKA